MRKTLHVIISLVFAVTAQKYNLEQRSNKLFGKALSEVLEEFRGTPEYLEILSQKVSNWKKTAKIIFLALNEDHTRKFLKAVGYMEHENADIENTRHNMEKNIKISSELLDHHSYAKLTSEEEARLIHLAYTHFHTFLDSYIQALSPGYSNSSEVTGKSNDTYVVPEILEIMKPVVTEKPEVSEQKSTEQPEIPEKKVPKEPEIPEKVMPEEGKVPEMEVPKEIEIPEQVLPEEQKVPEQEVTNEPETSEQKVLKESEMPEQEVTKELMPQEERPKESEIPMQKEPMELMPEKDMPNEQKVSEQKVINEPEIPDQKIPKELLPKKEIPKEQKEPEQEKI